MVTLPSPTHEVVQAYLNAHPDMIANVRKYAIPACSEWALVNDCDDGIEVRPKPVYDPIFFRRTALAYIREGPSNYLRIVYGSEYNPLIANGDFAQLLTVILVEDPSTYMLNPGSVGGEHDRLMEGQNNLHRAIYGGSRWQDAVSMRCISSLVQIALYDDVDPFAYSFNSHQHHASRKLRW
jgi:hypothetical protein